MKKRETLSSSRTQSAAAVSSPVAAAESIPLRHLRFGWWSLLVWLVVGLALEVLHGFKVGWYLDVGYETRRLVFTLAHTHGGALALVNLAAAACLRAFPELKIDAATSTSLLAASVLLPVGFLLGGIVVHQGDPGLGILLSPVGALFLVFAIARLALASQRMSR
jgi:glycine/D-amino acid oxidase-like deaminating enzyme